MKKTKKIKKTLQLYSAEQAKLSPEQAFQFLNDFQLMVAEQDTKSKLISLRVPENILSAFKIQAKSKNYKYQSLIVKLMREWIVSRRGKVPLD